MFRKAAVITAGLAMAAGIGLAGVGAASAATPSVVPGATSAVKAAVVHTTGNWTFEVTGGGCEVITFSSDGTWVATFGEYGDDAGIWAGGGTSISMYWNAGADTGLLFSGTYAAPKYKGSLGGIAFGDKGKLVPGEVSGC
jgi:hypothetical protein